MTLHAVSHTCAGASFGLLVATAFKPDSALEWVSLFGLGTWFITVGVFLWREVA